MSRKLVISASAEWVLDDKGEEIGGKAVLMSWD